MNKPEVAIEHYLLHVCDVIFLLLDMEDNTENKPMHEYYYALIRKAMFISRPGPRKKINELADEIYRKLRKKKREWHTPSGF